MEGVPKKVNITFERMKKEYKNLVLISKNGHYYVYRNRSYWDKAAKRPRVETSYLGLIEENGIFKEKRAISSNAIERAKHIIESIGGKVTLPAATESVVPVPEIKPEDINEVDRRILKALSMNARLPAGKIGKLVGLSPQATYRRIKFLGEKLGIKYILELNTNRLGYIDLLAFVKFDGKLPSPKEIKDAFEKEPYIQFCALLKGDYDIMLYILADKDLEATDVILDKILKNTLVDYTLSWDIKIVLLPYNFIPIREQFFDVLERRVWKKSKESPRPKPTDIRLREYLLLKGLNSNSVERFRRIDVRYNLENGNSRYSYFDLLDRKIISRPTITMTKLPIQYNAIIEMAVWQRGEYERTKNYYRLDLINDTKYPINKYSLAYGIRDPNGVFLIMPIMENNDLENTVANLGNNVRGVKFKTFMITSVLIGNLCYRLFDNFYSMQYVDLTNTGYEKVAKQPPKYFF
ncbi:MAG: AsnC family transcriptional regulator [Candidatus Micrarchaeota archaeon]|nr:AsnC family transcriptional regulator [Candidatus Micrarchaeota archaeon]